MNLEDRKKNFLNKAKEKWGDRFSYDLSNYDTDRSTISITDNETGEIFEFQPRNHLRTVTGKPTQTEQGQKRSYDQNKFIGIVKEKFGDQLDLSEAIYNGSGGLVIVTCRIHGNRYRTRASLLMHGHSGCPDCAIQNMKDSSYTRKVNWDDPEVIERLKELVNSGETFTKIGEIFGVSGHQVGVIVSKYDIDVPDFKAEENKKFTELVESGKSLSEIAKIYGITYEAAWIKAKSLKLDYKTVEIFDPTSISKEYIEDRIMSGNTVVDISNSLGLTRDKVQRSIDFYGIDIWARKASIDKEYLEKIEDLSSSGHTCSEISRLTGISYYKIKDLADKNNIELPKYETNTYRKEDLEKYAATGLSIKEIADTYYNGVDPSAVLDAYKRYGVEYNCNKIVSTGELQVARFLKENDIKFSQQVRISGEMKGRNSDVVIIDFIVQWSNKTTWIEYNGEQHYKYCPHFHNGSFDDFRKQIERDTEIRRYCQDHDIRLIEIPYTIDTFKGISKFLKSTLIDGDAPDTIIDYKSLYEYEM